MKYTSNWRFSLASTVVASVASLACGGGDSAPVGTDTTATGGDATITTPGTAGTSGSTATGASTGDSTSGGADGGGASTASTTTGPTTGGTVTSDGAAVTDTSTTGNSAGGSTGASTGSTGSSANGGDAGSNGATNAGDGAAGATTGSATNEAGLSDATSADVSSATDASSDRSVDATTRDAGADGPAADASDASTKSDASSDGGPTTMGALTDKADVLFMIDNSSSMGEKQTLLAAAVPALIRRLADPPCVDRVTRAIVSEQSSQGCAASAVAAYVPINDIHVGAVSSSLGSHGADAVSTVCPDSSPTNDLAHLLTRGTTLSAGQPFLVFGGSGADGGAPAGDAGAALNQFVAQAQLLIGGAGQNGCGYESQLESIYRFLVDPSPPGSITTTGLPNNIASYGPIDTVLLTQRKAFLRPDSLVIVVIVTDENDCSISDVGNGNLFLVSDGTGGDPYFPDNMVNDPATLYKNHPNLRCFHQKQRFGIDALWPVQRYIDGFTKTTITETRTGLVANNPLFINPDCPAGSTTCVHVRDGRLVSVALLAGMPWQDVAKDPTDLTKGILSASDLVSQNRWPGIIGDPANLVDPTDPFMIESRVPRTTGAMNPYASVAISAPTAATFNPINGHEWTPSGDLEFACLFPLPQPVVCSTTTICDCFGGDDPATTHNPVCQNGATFSATQLYGKGYPSVRELQVAKGLGDRAVVGSICPQTANATNPELSYGPVMDAIATRIIDTVR